MIVDGTETSSHIARAYNYAMIGVIAVSLIPLATKDHFPIFSVTENICVTVFIIDYILRWMTADYAFKRSGIVPFLRYPFTPMAIIDLVSILPYFLAPLSQGLIALRILRLARALRVFRVFRYSKSFRLLGQVFVHAKDPLLAVCALAAGYVFICALIIFNVEPETFDTFFDAVYWAVVSLTTVGYGDIYPVTPIGRAVTIVSSIFGVAIIALPAGIITAGYMSAVYEERENAKAHKRRHKHAHSKHADSDEPTELDGEPSHD